MAAYLEDWMKPLDGYRSGSTSHEPLGPMSAGES